MVKTMNDYILETPKRVLTNLKNRKSLVKDMLDLFFEKEYKNICIVASGSSFNGAVCAKPLMQKLLKRDIKVVPPYTFENYDFKYLEDTFTIVISQSGSSTNSIRALKKLKSVGIPAIGLTGNTQSDFKNFADYILDYGCGIETVHYVTIGVVTLIEYLYLFSLEAALHEGNISTELYDDYIKEIELAMKAHQMIYKATEDFIKKNYKALTSMNVVYICGCGPNYGTALEGSLKIGETVLIPVIPYETEELIHGPYLQLTPNYTIFFIDNGDHTSERTVELYHNARYVTDRVFIISNDDSIDDQYAIRCDIETNEYISPLYKLVPFQLIAYQITEDLNRWKKHPLYYKFSKNAGSKTESYSENEKFL